jgi:hypothetical protein
MPMPAPRVIAVAPGGVDAFVDATFELHEGDPEWIPPLREAERAGVAGAAVPGGTVRPFLCTRGGRVVGRAAALVNPRLRDRSGVPLGQVGFYDCADDAEAAARLLGAVLDALRREGARAVVGPMDGGAHRRHRLLARGFERAPFLLEPRNPPWHLAHFAAAGFEVVHRWTTYELERPALEALHAELARLARRGTGHVERPDPRDRRVLARIHSLLDAAWAGHPGYAPFGLGEFGAAFGPLLAILPAGHLQLLVGDDGADRGYAFLVPDRAAEVRALAGDAAGWGRWPERPLPRRVLGHTVAVAPAARGRAAPFQLIAAGLEQALEAGYDTLVFPLTTERFRFWSHRFPATREHVLLGRALAAA